MKNVCLNCHRLKHHKNAIYCFGCGKKLITKSSRFPFQKIGIGIGIFLALCFGIFIINFAVEAKEIQERQIAIKIQALPSQWQSVYFSINALRGDSVKKIKTFDNIVTNDLPKLTPDNIHLLMSVFYTNNNKSKVASKLMEFRK